LPPPTLRRCQFRRAALPPRRRRGPKTQARRSAHLGAWVALANAPAEGVAMLKTYAGDSAAVEVERKAAAAIEPARDRNPEALAEGGSTGVPTPQANKVYRLHLRTKRTGGVR